MPLTTPQSSSARRGGDTGGKGGNKGGGNGARGGGSQRGDGANARGELGNTGGVDRIWLIVAVLAGAITLTLTLTYSGALAANITGLDPGVITHWGVPIAQSINDYAMATTIGALIFAVFILPPLSYRTRSKLKHQGTRVAESDYSPAFRAALLTAQIGTTVWTLAAVAMLVFSFSDISGQALSTDANFSAAFMDFVLNIAYGQAWMITAILGAVITTFAFAFRAPTALLLTLVLAFVALTPKALIGHAAGGDDHNGATNAIFLHLLGVCVWVGGLITLVMISRTLGPATAAVLKRYSTLALISFVVVALSGVVSTQVRMEHFSQIFSPWGTLIIAKVVFLVALFCVGLWHRSWIIPKIASGQEGSARSAGASGAVRSAQSAGSASESKGSLSAKRVLWQVVGVELVLMSAVMAVAVSLSRTAPPKQEKISPDATPARILTGYDLPPELTPSRLVSVWRPDWLFLAVILLLAVGYLRGVWVLHRRGDRWPWARTASWLVGLLIFVYVTSGAPAVYGDVIISMHMVSHMVMTMVIPLFLVLGMPVTLALKVLRSRKDGSRGPREWILWAIHTPVAKFLTNPVVAAVIFAGSIIAFYSTPLFSFALRQHPGHVLMVVHFVLSGYLFALCMVGSDPVPKRAPYPMRFIILLATMAFHAFYGVALMGSDALLVANWFGNMGRTWGLSALEDQRAGAGYMWGIGEIPTVLMAIGVAVLWSRSDEREQKRRDRQAQRNNDAELLAYNDMFAKLAAQDSAQKAAQNSATSPGPGTGPSTGPSAQSAEGTAAKTATENLTPEDREKRTDER